MDQCILCSPEADEQQKIIFENKSCYFIQKDQRILKGSGLIVPKSHKTTVFDLSKEEWMDTQEMIQQVKEWLDDTLQPDGYNIGYNCYKTGGQHIFHAHMHIIPRFQDEPHAGKGIRHWLKQEENKRYI
ncbi:HIT domain-containing protein [Halobacillus litoralis]|uniref:HIT domain-containing protein n=1 Tax=Halobacillus litoralis TaxID=45668 RepID=A0A845DYH5_9BACI|nr:HIT family protein [Halobacillus litoralis]MYL48395.1 HIT domain-containing protein [Halobacillus litoralis]